MDKKPNQNQLFNHDTLTRPVRHPHPHAGEGFIFATLFSSSAGYKLLLLTQMRGDSGARNYRLFALNGLARRIS